MLRRLFGFSGTTLTLGAVGGGCMRCDAEAIRTYIDALPPAIDVDASGEVDPLSDGLLTLRRMFGVSGATLTVGAVENDCTRCEAGAIGGYIDDL